MMMIVMMMYVLLCRCTRSPLRRRSRAFEGGATKSAETVRSRIHPTALGTLGARFRFGGRGQRSLFGTLLQSSIARECLYRLQSGSHRLFAWLWPPEISIHLAEELIG